METKNRDMKKIEPTDPIARSADLKAENIDKLKVLFRNC